jgi:hypothetical protein
MKATNSEKCKQICREVWLDRANILTGNDGLSGETALVRAVYWRLCKTGDEPEQSLADTPFLKELVQQYRDETAQS